MKEKPPAPHEPWRDPKGSRRWPRHVFRIKPRVRVGDGSAVLIDLSVGGAQLLAPSSMPVGDRREMVLRDQLVALRLPFVVVQTRPEDPLNPDSPYRIGLRFEDVTTNSAAIRAFIARHP